MAVKIRLTRMGRKKRPFYRIVVTDSRTPRDGRYIESIGTYNPIVDPPEIKVLEERANYWLDHGAIPTDTVKSLLKHKGVIYKRYLRKKGFEEAKIDEEIKKWEVLQLERERRKAAEKQAKKKEKGEEVEPEKTDEVAEAETEEEKVAPAEEKEEIEISEGEKKDEKEIENKAVENGSGEVKNRKDEKETKNAEKVENNEEGGGEKGESTDE